MNDEPVYRTAPATPGLLNTYLFLLWLQKVPAFMRLINFCQSVRMYLAKSFDMQFCQ